ncbi:hypothetical protein ACFLYP_02200 [Chloroflexota bacterium]
MSKELIMELENLRRELVRVDHAIGDAYDYLDRGNPDEEQWQATWEQISDLQGKQGYLAKDLSNKVGEVHADDPGAIERWVDLHVEVYQRVRERFRTAEGETIPPREDAYLIINSALAGWEEVRAGKQFYVWTNRYLMEGHQDIVEDVFGQ